jgi:hypothetical protein
MLQNACSVGATSPRIREGAATFLSRLLIAISRDFLRYNQEAFDVKPLTNHNSLPNGFQGYRETDLGIRELQALPSF